MNKRQKKKKHKKTCLGVLKGFAEHWDRIQNERGYNDPPRICDACRVRFVMTCAGVGPRVARRMLDLYPR